MSPAKSTKVEEKEDDQEELDFMFDEELEQQGRKKQYTEYWLVISTNLITS